MLYFQKLILFNKTTYCNQMARSRIVRLGKHQRKSVVHHFKHPLMGLYREPPQTEPLCRVACEHLFEICGRSVGYIFWGGREVFGELFETCLGRLGADFGTRLEDLGASLGCVQALSKHFFEANDLQETSTKACKIHMSYLQCLSQSIASYFFQFFPVTQRPN